MKDATLPVPDLQPGRFKVRTPASIARLGDLQLACAECGIVACDIEAGDDLYIIADMAADHWDTHHAGKKAS